MDQLQYNLAPHLQTVSQTASLPNTITIGTGGNVIWKNNDNEFHTVVSGNPRNGPDGIFDSEYIQILDKHFSHKFNTSGTYDYFCMIHPWMDGKVIVKGSSAISTPTLDVSSSDPSFRIHIEDDNRFSIEYPKDWLKGADGLAHWSALEAFSDRADWSTMFQVFWNDGDALNKTVSAPVAESKVLRGLENGLLQLCRDDTFCNRR